MIERLRGLEPPLRHVTYLAVMLLAFLVAVGVGAMAALAVGGFPEQVASGSGALAQSRMAGETTSERTNAVRASELTDTKKTANDADSPNRGQTNSEKTTTFVHRATAANSRGDYTYISDAAIDADANAIVLATPTTPDRGSASSTASSAARADADTYGHNIGVWFEGVDKKKWAIFNQDRAPVPEGSTFEVVVPLASESFVHRAGPANIVGNVTYLDNPLTNGHPDAAVSITQNWNPGGGRGVYNDHPVDILYDRRAEEWLIYNLDLAPMPDGAAFNVAVRPGSA